MRVAQHEEVHRRRWSEEEEGRNYRANEYVFPADESNVCFKWKQAYAWDMRRPFQAACDRAGIKGLGIHDLRHMATSILFVSGIPEAIIRKLTGHRSREL
jgi:integrase